MKETAATKLQQALQTTDLTDYQGIPFWSWNNELDETELVKQIDEMKAVGIGGFIMHARIGLKTEYLGEKWFSCIDACLKRARELKMNAWVYDENGWPSGFVGGKLLEREDFRAQYLEYEVKEAYDADALCVFEKTTAGYVRVYGNIAGVTEYHCVYLRTSPANTDILNPELVDAFIQETHEKYYERYADSFGKELVGFFTDEPQYFRWATPYTRWAEKPYKERFGEDLANGLIYLFVHDTHGYVFRQRYYQLLNELYTDNFYKKLYDWCEAHNCKLTGHSVEESALFMQMWGGAAVMPSYEFEHIPGIDCLGRNCQNDMAARQVGSASAQMGRKQILTETYGCSGFDVTPRELTSIAEAQYFSGVNLMCHHLLPYSMAAQGKTDHPPVFSKQNNWWEQFRVFNDHFTTLGYLVANTKETYDVAVVHPMRNVYLEYVRTEDYQSVEKIEKDFEELLAFLRKNGVRYQFLDERLLQRHGKAENGKIVLGNCEYDTVIVPKMATISASTNAILEAYTGKMLLMGDIRYVDGKKQKVSLTSNCTMEDILGARGVKFVCEDGYSAVSTRVGELGDYMFIKNFSRTEESKIFMEGVAEAYQALNLETFELTNITNDMTIAPSGSLILVASEEAKPESFTESRETITENFAVTGITDNFLVLDFASYSLDGETYSERQPIQMLFETILRKDYTGDVYIKQTFNVKDVQPMKVVLEKSNFKFVRINGVDVTLGDNDFDINFTEADITSLIKEGENELLYCVDYYQHDGVWFALFDPEATESVRNCLYYDTHLEPAFIKGDFIVDETYSICRKVGLPKITSSLYENGYPFFKGVLTMQGGYHYDGNGSRAISLEQGRFLVAEMEINGQRVDMIFDSKMDVTKYLQVGNNDIVIRLRSSLRNLFGPHHFKYEREPLGVSPVIFTFRGTWNGEISPMYTEEYQCVPFGVDAIEMIKW